MEKEYTVKLQAEVIGASEVEKLADDMASVAKNAELATQSISQLDEETGNFTNAIEENTNAQQSLNTTQENTANTTENVVQGLTQGYFISMAWRGAIKGFVAILPALATALAIVTAGIIAYRGAMAAAQTYLESNREAMIAYQRTLMDTTAWTAFKRNIELYVGEPLFKVANAWDSFLTNVKLAALYFKGGLFGRTSVLDAVVLQAKVERLNQEMETYLENQAMAQRQQALFVREINDETKSFDERRQASEGWAKWRKTELEDQQTLLLLQSEILAKQIETGEISGEDLPKARESQRKLKAEIKEVGYALQDITYEQNQYNKAIDSEEYNKYLDDLQTQRDLLKDITELESYQVTTTQQMLTDLGKLAGSKNLLGEDDDSLFKMVGMPTPEEQDYVYDALQAKRLDYYDYVENSQYQHYSALTGNTLNFIDGLKTLYNLDLDWHTLTWEKKLEIAAEVGQGLLAIAGSLTSQMASVASDDFETQKKYQLAGVVIDTLTGMLSAFVGGVQTIPGPGGVILGAVLAAVVGVFGALQYNKIKNSKPDGGTAPSSSTPSAPTISAPSLSLVSPVSPGEEQLATAINAETDPQQAYVVSTDMTSQQELDRRIDNNATI